MNEVIHALAAAGLVVGCIAAVAAVLVVVDDFLHRDRKEKQR
jgi:hypothetical protein